MRLRRGCPGGLPPAAPDGRRLRRPARPPSPDGEHLAPPGRPPGAGHLRRPGRGRVAGRHRRLWPRRGGVRPPRPRPAARHTQRRHVRPRVRRTRLDASSAAFGRSPSDDWPAVKGDPPTPAAFARACAGVRHDTFHQSEAGHGREEERSVTGIDDPDGRPFEWVGRRRCRRTGSGWPAGCGRARRTTTRAASPAAPGSWGRRCRATGDRERVAVGAGRGVRGGRQSGPRGSRRGELGHRPAGGGVPAEARPRPEAPDRATPRRLGRRVPASTPPRSRRN